MATKRPDYKKAKPQLYKPPDWLFGGRQVGSKYTAWSTDNREKPDFGKGAGPGEPFRKITKRVMKTGGPGWKPSAPTGPKIVGRSTDSANKSDPRTEAIRRRLRGL